MLGATLRRCAVLPGAVRVGAGAAVRVTAAFDARPRLLGSRPLSAGLTRPARVAAGLFAAVGPGLRVAAEAQILLPEGLLVAGTAVELAVFAPVDAPGRGVVILLGMAGVLRAAGARRVAGMLLRRHAAELAGLPGRVAALAVLLARRLVATRLAAAAAVRAGTQLLARRRGEVVVLGARRQRLSGIVGGADAG